MTRPAHRPPKHEGGYVGAVERLLRGRIATRREIEAVLGYSRSAVQKAIYALRLVGSPVLVNIRHGESGRPRISDPRVIAALESRSLLEQAWGAQA